MKQYLLDTSLVAGYLLDRKKAIDIVSPLIEREEAATSILVYGEVVEYVKSFTAFRTYRESLQALLEQIDPLPLTYPILERYADLRRKLRPPYVRFHPYSASQTHPESKNGSQWHLHSKDEGLSSNLHHRLLMQNR